MNRFHAVILALVLAVAALLAQPVLTGYPPASAKDAPARRIAVLHNDSYTSGDALSADFQASSAHPVSAIRITVCLSGTATTMNIDVDDGNTTESCTLNSATDLAAGSMYTFVVGIAQEDQDGDTLNYNVSFGASTTIDYLVIDEALVGAP